MKRLLKLIPNRFTVILLIFCISVILFYMNNSSKTNADEGNPIELNTNLEDNQGFVFELDTPSEGMASVAAFNNSTGNIYNTLTIPDYVRYGDEDYIVSNVDFACIAGVDIELLRVADSVTDYDNINTYNILVKTLYIGREVKELEYMYLYQWSNLQNIYISPDNNDYSSEKGIMYDFLKTTVLAYPAGRLDSNARVADTVVSIADNAFRNSKVDEIDNLKCLSVGVSAFENSAIKYIDLSMTVDIAERAFYHCYNLNNVSFFDSVHIGEMAFYNCNSLKWLYLPGDITIDNSAFCYCNNLELVAIGEGSGVGTSIDVQGNGEFFNCYNIKQVYFPETMKTINGVFNTIDKNTITIHGVYIPYGVTTKKRMFGSLEEPYNDNHNVAYVYGKPDINEQNVIIDKEAVFYQDEDGILLGDRYCSYPKADNFAYYRGMKHISLDKAYEIYGEGWAHFDGSSVTGRGVLGIAVPLNMTIPYGRSVRVIAKCEAAYPLRIWLSDESSGRLSEVNRVFDGLPTILKNNSEDCSDSNCIIIKGKNSSFIVDELNIYDIFVQILDEDDKSTTVYPVIMPDTNDVCRMPDNSLYDLQATKYEAYTGLQDNSYNLSWLSSDEDRLKGCMLRFDEPKNLNEYNYLAVDIAGNNTYNVSIKDYYHIDTYGGENNLGRIYNTTLPGVLNLSEMQKEGMDYSSVIAVAIQPSDKDAADSINISSLTFYKNEEDIPEFAAQKPVPTPLPTVTPTASPAARPTPTPTPTPTQAAAATSSPLTTLTPPVMTVIPEVTKAPEAGTIPNDTTDTQPSATTKEPISVKTPEPRKEESTSGLKRPVIKVSKGKTSSGITYLLVRIRRYSGKYIQIYAGSGKKINQIRLKSNNIKANKASFKLKYSKRNTTIRIKVRTFSIKNKKKIYSSYSAIKKIKV